MMFEAVEQIELRDRPGAPPELRLLGTYATEDEAIEVARAVRREFRESGRHDYAWWTVRQAGMTVANWIADASSSKEFVLDLRSGELVER